MFVNDVLSDMVARINNAQQSKLSKTQVIKSKLNAGVLEVLKKEGFITSYEEEERFLKVNLKYDMGKPIISIFKRVSKPGRRVYSKISNLPKFYNGLGISILSTPKGVMTDHEEKQLNVGGEVLCTVF